MTNQSGQEKEQLLSLAKTYVPEWRFSRENPDVGSVTAILIDDMLKESRARLSEVLHKHKIQYLNLFDSLKDEPIESAKSYVRFTQVASVDEPVAVPRGTRLIAENEKTGEQLTFETTYGITATQAMPVTVYTTDGENDNISCLLNISADSSSNYSFPAFGIGEQNEAQHVMLFAYDNAFDELNELSIGLRISVLNKDELDSTLDLMLSANITYSILEPLGERVFDKIERKGDLIWLTLANYTPQRVEQNGKEQYVLSLRARAAVELRISSCELVFAEDNLPSDEVLCAGVSQNVGQFLPFGKPMEIYAECAIENRVVLARRGAEIKMSFELGFEVMEQQLPQTVDEPDYKVVMKKPKAALRMETAEIHADYILIEYKSNSGWKRLLPDENAALLMNGSVEGEVCLSFTCPMDLAPAAENDGRLRLRLMRADNLYRIPCNQYCPRMRNLHFSYSYESMHLLPDYACTHNNFEVKDITAALANKREIETYYSLEGKERAMYLGFDKCPSGMPMSLYFEIENDEDTQLFYSSEYLTERGFEEITAVDNTGGMLYSGTMLFPIDDDAVCKKLFNHDYWWIRLRLKASENRSLPIIRKIITNMARVENLRSQSETFYITEENAAFNIKLREQNLISVRVFVNEDDGNDENEENWVLWHKRIGYGMGERFCDIDTALGTIEFGKYAFAAYPLKQGKASVKVEYQSYQGAGANVAADTITGMAESVQYIAQVTNPMAAYGGYDGYNEKTSAGIISNMLRTRTRAVTGQDYFDIIAQVSYGVHRIKCLSGVNRLGEKDSDAITVALLIDEYDKGSHIFSSVKDTIRQKLTETGSIVPLGKTLVLSQPYFVRFKALIWLETKTLDGAYDLQQQILQDVQTFIDPLVGGFDGDGWEIGVLPNVKQLLAYLKMKRPGIAITRIAMSAQTHGREYAVDDELYAHIQNPFAMAVNGKHTIYIKPTEKQMG
ncbi:MAG: hypothetical protein RSD78_03065 [Oscillospiraceae bacterium]